MQGPLEIIGIMFAATGIVLCNGKSKRLQTIPPRLMLRKWLKVLIDRSLVLGTVDRPQLHDIVLEYVESQFTEDACREAHREVINKFREVTPRGGWNRMETGSDLTTYYVVHEIEHHMAAAWHKDAMSDTVAIGWCSHLWRGKMDAISSAATFQLSWEKLETLADDAAAKNEHWRAVRQYAAVIYAMYEESMDLHKVYSYCNKAIAELKLCTCDTPELQFEHDTIEIDLMLRLIKCWNPDDMDVLIPQVPALMETEAAESDFQAIYLLNLLVEVIPDLFAGKSENFARAVRGATYRQLAVTRGLNDKAQVTRSKFLEIGFTTCCFDGCTAELDFIDAMYGERGSRIEPVYAEYDRDTDHADAISLFTVDLIIACVGEVKALLFFWGEYDRALAMVRWHQHEAVACIATKTVTAELPTIWMVCSYLPEMMLLLGLQSEAHGFIQEAFNNVAYENLEDALYSMLALLPMITTTANPTEGAVFNGISSAWHTKFTWLLSAPQATLDKLKPEHLFAGLPSAHALALSHFEGTALKHSHPFVCEIALMCWPALLFERLGMYERAIEFADQAIQTDVFTGGCTIVWNYILAHGVKGRIFLKTDKTAEAVKEFELAAGLAAARRYKFLEAIALRDLKSALPQATSKHSATDERFHSVMAGLAHGSSQSKQNLEKVVDTLFLTWD